MAKQSTNKKAKGKGAAGKRKRGGVAKPAKDKVPAATGAPAPEVTPAGAELTQVPTDAAVVAEAPATTGRTAPKAMTCLDAAAAVLRGNGGQPMGCGEMVAAMAERGLWTTAAPTPTATLYSAILREIGRKGADARFAKAGRGRFALTPAAGGPVA